MTSYSTMKTLIEQDLDNITVTAINAVPHLVLKDCCMHSERCNVCIVYVSTAWSGSFCDPGGRPFNLGILFV